MPRECSSAVPRQLVFQADSGPRVTAEGPRDYFRIAAYSARSEPVL